MRNIFGRSLKGFPQTEEPLVEPLTGKKIVSDKSGYVQFIDEKRLFELATCAGASFFVVRSVGQFVPAGVPSLVISPFGAANETLVRESLKCFHIGPLRSLEDDVEFGVLQLVDIALKAISPAVNDPSTAISCIDHLSAVLLTAATLEPPKMRVMDDSGTVRLERRQTSFVRLLDTAYNQIIPYGKGDMAVSLRIMRALYDVSGVTNFPPYLAAIRKQAQQVARGCSDTLPAEECQELLERLATIEIRQRTLTDLT